MSLDHGLAVRAQAGSKRDISMYDIIIRAGRQGNGQLIDIAIQDGKIAALGAATRCPPRRSEPSHWPGRFM